MIMGKLDTTNDAHSDFLMECITYLTIKYPATIDQVASFVGLSGDFSLVIKHLELMSSGTTYTTARKLLYDEVKEKPEIYVLQFSNANHSLNGEEHIDELKCFSSEDKLDNHVKENHIKLGFSLNKDNTGHYSEYATKIVLEVL